MSHQDILLVLLLVLFSAKLFGSIFKKLNIPPVLGEILAGIVIGPSLLGWVEFNEVLKILAEIGVILLLFEVGLESDVAKLLKSGKYSFIVAVMGFIFPFILGSLIGIYLFKFDLIVSMFIGGTITATSIGITIRVLQDLNKRNTDEAEIIIGAAVLDDILGVILLALLYEFSQAGEIKFVEVSKVFIFILAFIILAPIFAKMIAYFINKYHLKDIEEKGFIASSVFMLVLFFGWLAKKVGAPDIIGGFAAGLALSRRFFLPFGIYLAQDTNFAKKVEDEIKPLVYVFVPFFFVGVGISMNLQEIDWGSSYIWILTFSILIAAIMGKIIGSMFLFSLSLKQRLIIGISMVPRGEVGLIFAELGRVSNILNNEVYAALVLVIVITTIIPPLIIKKLYSL